MVRYAQIDKEEGIFLLYLGLLLLAGILQGIMVSLNGQMGNYFSLFGICFFVHAIALVLHVGASAFMALSTAGQLVSSALIDRFGLFGMPVTRIRRQQLPGYALVLLGVILVVLN